MYKFLERRKISVKDLGSGDLQGWLYQRCRSKNTSNVNWDLRWYVLVGNTLYGFKNKDVSIAYLMLFLCNNVLQN